MHHGFALRYIADVMRWPAETEEKETAWLRLMSEFKYDSYHDFLSGSRFVEALLDWLQQFEPADRPTAYRLLREHLIFISSPEMQHLVTRAYAAHIQPVLEYRVAQTLKLPRYLLSSTPASLLALKAAIRRTLFVGLSDGARLDFFRRANSGLISNEQVIPTPEMADEKWEDVQVELRKATKDDNAVFETIVLLDDFTASGTSLMQIKDGRWKGKLVRTCKQLNEHRESLAQDYSVIVHHYLGTSEVEASLQRRLLEVRAVDVFAPLFKAGQPIISFGMLITERALVRLGSYPEVDALLERYFDPSVMTSHLRLGGKDVKHGFAGCGLPLVLEHNAPNNSLGILWAESLANSTGSHLMRPLFRRRQRHM